MLNRQQVWWLLYSRIRILIAGISLCVSTLEFTFTLSLFKMQIIKCCSTSFYVASDDLVFPFAFDVLLRFGFSVVFAVVAVDAWVGCGVVVKGWLCAALGTTLVSAFLLAAITLEALKGGVLEPHARAAVGPLLKVRLVAVLPLEICVGVLGFLISWHYGSSSTSSCLPDEIGDGTLPLSSPSYVSSWWSSQTAIQVVTTWFVVDCLVSIVSFGCLIKTFFGKRNGCHAYFLNLFIRLAVRLDDEAATFIMATIAEFAPNNLMRGVHDLSPTDGVAALLLYWRACKIQEGRRLLLLECDDANKSRDQQQATTTAPTCIQGKGVVPTAMSSANEEMEVGDNSTTAAADLATTISPPPPSLTELEELRRACWLSLAVYGWPLHAMRNAQGCKYLTAPCVASSLVANALCARCCSCSCAVSCSRGGAMQQEKQVGFKRRFAGRSEGDNCFGCHASALAATLDDMEKGNQGSGGDGRGESGGGAGNWFGGRVVCVHASWVKGDNGSGHNSSSRSSLSACFCCCCCGSSSSSLLLPHRDRVGAHPAWSVFVDPFQKAVVVCVRGTLSPSDVATDLWCDEAPLLAFDEDGDENGDTCDNQGGDKSPAASRGSGGIGGVVEAAEMHRERTTTQKGPTTGHTGNGGDGRGASGSGSDDVEVAHAGVVKTAAHVFDAILESGVLCDLLDHGRCPGSGGQGGGQGGERDRSGGGIDWSEVASSYKLVLSGHSLGAGIASVVARTLRHHPATKHWKHRTVCRLVSPVGALYSRKAADATDDHTLSITFGDEAVTRLSRRAGEVGGVEVCG
jgi:hypothetical protein